MTINKDIIRKAISDGFIAMKDGRLFNSKTKKYRKLRIGKLGYPYIRLRYKNNKFKTLRVHRLVAFQKFGDKIFNKNIEVRHKNNNRQDNRESNILIGTNSDNKLDIPKNIRMRISSVAHRKFTNKKIKNILKDRNKGSTYRLLCKKYKVSKSFLSYLFNKAIYKNKLHLKTWNKSVFHKNLKLS